MSLKINYFKRKPTVQFLTVERALSEISIKKKLSKNIKMKNLEHDDHIYYLEYLLDAFDIGLPCQSSLLELEHLSNDILKNKAPKVMIEYCEVIFLRCYYLIIFVI